MELRSSSSWPIFYLTQLCGIIERSVVPLYFILYMIFCLGCKVKQGIQTPAPDEGWQYTLLSFSQAFFSSHRINRRPQIRESSIWAETSLSIQTSSLKRLCRRCSSIQAFNHCLCAVVVPFVITTFFPTQAWGKMSYTCDLGKLNKVFLCTSVSAIDQSIRAFFSPRCCFCFKLCPAYASFLSAKCLFP